MHPHIISAVLTDSAGKILLVRRKNSALWTLPGGEPRGPVRPADFLVACCRRQVGVSPDFVAPFFTFAFAGRTVAFATDEIPHDRARACGRVETSAWFEPDQLPVGVSPLARMAISLRTPQFSAPVAPPALALAC